MFKDSHRIHEGFKRIVEDDGFKKSLFVMGRYLGSFSAIELAYSHQNDLRGLIVDSGPSNNLRQWFSSIVPLDHPLVRDDSTFLNKVKLRSISKPTLIIHGERDSLISVDEGKELYDNSAAKDKGPVIIPNVDHNDLFTNRKKNRKKAVLQSNRRVCKGLRLTCLCVCLHIFVCLFVWFCLSERRRRLV